MVWFKENDMTQIAGIVITDGVGYRNFILTNFLNQLPTQFEKTIIYSCLPDRVYPKQVRERFHIREIEIYREGTLTGFFRKTKEIAHLYKNSTFNFGIQDNLMSNRNYKFTRRGILTRLSFTIASIFHSEKWILIFTKWQLKSLKNLKVTHGYKSLLTAEKPDVLFFTHQRPSFIAPLLSAAEQLNIPTAAFIFSWDNIASKGRMAGNFNYYIVWSELMKKELLKFYTSIMKSQVHIGGTPQFEPYVMDYYKTSHDVFIQRFDIDRGKPTICFSCGDISTSKNDELYIKEIATAIIDKEIIKDVNFIVRTSPAEHPKRFFSLTKQFTFIKWNFPNWVYARDGHPEPWTQRVPLEQDVRDLRAILEFCDININMCSTMSLDFMQFDKPVINPVFGDGLNGLYNDQRYLKYAHYENVVKSGAVEIVKNKKELVNAINEALVNPGKKSNQRKELLKLQIGRPLNGTSENMVQILAKIGSK